MSLTDLISQLVAIRVDHGNIPVMISAHSFEFGGVSNYIDSIELRCEGTAAVSVALCGLEAD
jgi:hypothetical protein